MVNRPIYCFIFSLSASELDLFRASDYKVDAFCPTNILQITLLVHITDWFCDQCVVD